MKLFVMIIVGLGCGFEVFAGGGYGGGHNEGRRRKILRNAAQAATTSDQPSASSGQDTAQKKDGEYRQVNNFSIPGYRAGMLNFVAVARHGSR